MKPGRSPRSIHARTAAHPTPAEPGAVSGAPDAQPAGAPPADAQPAGTLPRRQPGAQLPSEPPPAAQLAAAPDEALLDRIHTALHTLR